MIRQYELVERVKAYDPRADEAMLNRAYVYSMKAHGNQVRASGDPYFSHPLEVAGILTELRLDPATIVTGLLHDTIEDTEATLEDIEGHFGRTVADLVDGVTKLSKLELNSEKTKQAENFRKLVLAMSKDIRVLLVKLADRLHNMRTLHFIGKPEKRVRIAQETLDIYAPLAGRIGMQDLREELEDLAFQQLDPKAYDGIMHRMVFLGERSEDVISVIAEEIGALLSGHGISAHVTGRQKRPYSMWRKMQTKEVSFEDLADTFGFRIVIDGDVGACYAALGLIHQEWQTVPGRFKDYISLPKSNGYQSIHTAVFGPERRKIEIQIRTNQMHMTAERGVAAHWRYKQGLNGHAAGQDGEIETAEYGWIQDLVAMLEHDGPADEFLEHTKLQLFQDQVFCFTPKGELIVLPKGATPIDFAYAVHTEIGDTCVGARVNGRQIPLHTALQNGDSVEILRSETQFPSPTWENIAITGRAKTAIRRFVRQRAREQYARLGRDILTQEFLRAKVEFSDKALGEGLKRLKHQSVEDVLVDVGQMVLAPGEVVEAVYPGRGAYDANDPPRPATHLNGEAGVAAIPIKGLIPGLAVHRAECCHPLPGDRIVGIRTPGRGLDVHTIDCAQLEKFYDEPDRWQDLSWEATAEEVGASLGRIKAVLMNVPGALGSMTNIISETGGNIQNLFIAERTSDFFTFVVDIEVSGAKHLSHINAALRAANAISSVRRVRG